MIPLRLVLDTSIIISTPSNQTVCSARFFSLRSPNRPGSTSTRPLLPSTPHLLARPELKIRKGLRQQLLQLIKSRCHCVAPTKRLQVTPDPDDDIFLDWRR